MAACSAGREPGILEDLNGMVLVAHRANGQVQAREEILSGKMRGRQPSLLLLSWWRPEAERSPPSLPELLRLHDADNLAESIDSP